MGLELPLDGAIAADLDGEFGRFLKRPAMGRHLVDLAELLLNSFFVPFKASGGRTSGPTPDQISAVERAEGESGGEFSSTPHRLAALRHSCLTRDHHRCVVSRKFEVGESDRREAEYGNSNALDDDGDVLYNGRNVFAPLEVAHIVPHALTQAKARSELKAALLLLNMFDYNVSHPIDGDSIDKPHNAITLTRDHHSSFGSFKIVFTPIPNPPVLNTYRIENINPAQLLSDIPVTRTLHSHPDIESPSARLLAVHRAIAHILHLSGAGAYIDRILRDAEDVGVRSDGSTELGRLVGLRLGGFDIACG